MVEEVKKAKKSAKPAEHPKYSDMVKAALGALKERTGSSRQAIEKYIKANYTVGDNCTSQLKLALKRMSEKGTILQTKGKGATGSFKLNKAIKEEKPKKPVGKKPVAKKPVAKKPVAKKPATKKATKKPTEKKAKSPKKTPKKSKTAAESKKDKPTAKPKPAKKAAKKPVKKPAKKAAKPTAKKTAKSPKK